MQLVAQNNLVTYHHAANRIGFSSFPRLFCSSQESSQRFTIYQSPVRKTLQPKRHSRVNLLFRHSTRTRWSDEATLHGTRRARGSFRCQEGRFGKSPSHIEGKEGPPGRGGRLVVGTSGSEPEIDVPRALSVRLRWWMATTTAAPSEPRRRVGGRWRRRARGGRWDWDVPEPLSCLVSRSRFSRRSWTTCGTLHGQ